MNAIKHLPLLLGCLSAGVSVLSSAQAPAWPQRPVRVIVNVSAGGGVDMVARIVAQHLTGVLGQTFVVDNRTGAGGIIGSEMTARATPDGYTFLVSSNTAITTAALHPQGSYDPVRDFQAVSKLTSNPYIICITPSLPVNTVGELIALSKSRPSGLAYGSAGSGSILHLASALFTVMANVPMVHVPYKGVADVYPAVAAGQVDWVVGSPISALPYIKSGRMRGIAVTSATRARALPNLPPVADTVPGYEVIAWFGMFAPTGTPMAIVNKVQAEAYRALHTPEVMRRMDAEGTDSVGGPPQQFAVEVKAELEKWRRVVKSAGITQ